jgi:SAM-dependent methyltransferase
LNPRPPANEVSGLYTEEYFRTTNLQIERAAAEVQKEIGIRYPTVTELTKESGTPGRWLDVGCASGFLLAAARDKGWEVSGIEVSSWAAQFAVEQLQLRVFCGSVEQFAGTWTDQPPFDVITAMSVLEHLPHPSVMVEAARSLLRPGGLLVLRVPNIASVDRLWHGRSWRGWQVPHHLYHFTPRSITQLLGRHGFVVQRIRRDWWNPLVHIREARLGDGLRADHRDEARTATQRYQSLGPHGESPNLVDRLKSMIRPLAQALLPGRDMIIYARRL